VLALERDEPRGRQTLAYPDLNQADMPDLQEGRVFAQRHPSPMRGDSGGAAPVRKKDSLSPGGAVEVIPPEMIGVVMADDEQVEVLDPSGAERVDA
jgi:hypothetical protein